MALANTTARPNTTGDITDSVPRVFDEPVAGLAEDPELLDETAKAPPALADGPLPKESRPLGASVSPACSTLDNGHAALGGMTFYEFFAGAGMVRLGLGPDWTCLLANDNDVDKAASYARNFSVHDLKIDDVACLTAADLPGHADLAWSSFPCQDLSLAGGRAGLGGARSGTFWSFWGLMMALRAAGRAPRLVVIENVCGLITGHGGKDFVALCDAFTEGGYRVGVMVIDAKFFVPQSRDRVFIIGVDATLPIPASIVVDQPALPFHDNAVVKALRRQAAPADLVQAPSPAAARPDAPRYPR